MTVCASVTVTLMTAGIVGLAVASALGFHGRRTTPQK